MDPADGFSRGSRSRGGDAARGGRSRGTERGRGKSRARDHIRGAKVLEEWDNHNGSMLAADAPRRPATTTSEELGWDVVNPADAIPPAVEPIKGSSKPDGTRTWASMFTKKSSPSPVTSAPKVDQKTQSFETPPAVSTVSESQLPIPLGEPPVVEEANNPLLLSASDTEPAVEVTPSEDQLTESNLQQVPGSPQEPATTTVVSNAGTNEVRTASGAITPVPGSAISQQPLRPGLGGFQTSALKATTPTPRSSSFIRRVKEQQEAVVMPGNHAVDRAAVQFGSLGLGNSSADFEMDDDREQPETREQPPQHSPVAPKAFLPAASQQIQPETTKTTSNLTAALGSHPSATSDQQATQPSGQSAYSYSQFGYAHPGQIGDHAAAQKGYEAFGQQALQTAAGSLNGYPSHSQTPNQPSQANLQSQAGNYSSAANDYSSYYTSDPQRNAYNVYGSYGQNQAPQDSSQKSGANFGATSASELPATVATSQAIHPGQTRFGTMDQNSGHSTPNLQNATQTQSQGQQAQQVSQGHGNQHAGYPYGTSNPYYGNYYPNYMGQHSYGRSDRPPYDDVRRYEDQYLNQTHHYGYGANQGAYGTSPYGGKYAQPHQGYGMPSQAWDTHAGSPANAGSYGQQPGASRENATAHAAYGRTGSTQPAEGQQQGTTAFGGMTDVFGRSGSAYSNQASHQQTQQGVDDTSRGYGDSSKAAGPSPVSGQNAARPTSAVNAQSQGSQAQNQQQNYGGYPGHSQQSHYGSNYGHQSTTQGHQSSGYGAYAGFGGTYYGNNSRGNWSGSYNH